MIQLNKLLHTAAKCKCSDIHLVVGRPPVLRIHGKLRALNAAALTPEDTHALMKSIAPEAAQERLNESGSADFSFEYEEGAVRFRVAIFRERGQVGIVLRAIPSDILSFEFLGLPSQIKQVLLNPRGMVLVTGPTGSGKSTTLTTMIHHLNETRDLHIITVEDPIEYYHEHKRSLVTQREVGVDVPDFAAAIRGALRQDPDVIFVGEMRDLETIQAALTAAETGHLVMATLHTNSAHGTVSRIIDAFPSGQQQQIRTQVASTLLCVISQQLVPRRDESGVVPAFEILVVTSAVRNMIREKKEFNIDSVIQMGRDRGMILLDDSLQRLCAQGVISREEALNRSREPLAMQEPQQG